MPAPVNTGDVWIVEDLPATPNACLDADFAVCPLPDIDYGLDEYYLHGGVMFLDPDRFWLMSGDKSDGSKLQQANNERERIRIQEFDFNGNARQVIIDYDHQILPPIVFRGTSHVQGDIRMYQGVSIEDDEFGNPQLPRYFFNWRDNPINSGLYYVLRDRNQDHLSDTIQSGAMILKDEKLFAMVSSSADPGYHVCTYDIPTGGPADLSTFVGRFMDVTAVATDALLKNVGSDSALILSDDARMFLFNNTSKTLVEFDSTFTVIGSWSLPAGSTRNSVGGAAAPIPIAANRIFFPVLSGGPYYLYELLLGQAPVIVHEWTAEDLTPYHTNEAYQALVGSDGLVFTHMKFTSTGPPYVALLNFKGTPDYTP